MAKKMRLPPLFKHKSPPHDQPSVSSSTRHSWVSCRDQPKTLSFRAAPAADVSTALFSLAQDSGDEAEELESVIRGVRSSERLFFSPDKTNSILEKTTTDHHKHSAQKCVPVLINMESLDPYMDFRTSMKEMVEAEQLRDWDLLEELLGCYLMVNEERNHCYIIRAFTDLVASLHFVHLASSSSSASLVSDSFVTSSSSPLHFSSSSTTAATSCSSSLAPPEAAHDRGRGDQLPC